MTLNDPVFGNLHDVYQGLYAPKRLWQSELRVDIFKEPMRVSFETTDELGVQDFHYKAYQDFAKQQVHYKKLALDTVMKYYYETILPLWKANNYFGVPELVPMIESPEELENLLTYPSLFLHFPKEGISSLGLSFECSWDVEHGVGVLLREGKMIQVGLAEVARYESM